MENKLKILIIGIIIAAIILGGVYSFIPAYVESDPSIVYTVVVGANLSGIESVEVNGTVCNDGDKEIKNVSINVIFTDTAHNEVVRKTVMERVDLLPNGVVYFTAEYLREQTLPKTEVDVEVQVDWRLSNLFWISGSEQRRFTAGDNEVRIGSFYYSALSAVFRIVPENVHEILRIACTKI